MNNDDYNNDDFYSAFSNSYTEEPNKDNNLVDQNPIESDNNNLSDISSNEVNSSEELKMQHDFKKKRKIFKIASIVIVSFVLITVTILVLAELKLIKLPWLDYPEVLNLSQNEVMLKKDSKFQFSTYVYPSQVKYGRIIFESTDPSVADINPITGYVEAKQNGVTTIKAYLEDYHDIYDTCDLVVSNNNVVVESIEVEHENVDMLVGNTYLLKYSYFPKNAGLHFFSYTSSDTSIITVNSKGEVTAIKPGKAVINILEEVSGNLISQEFTVYNKLSSKPNDNYVVSSIKLSSNDINLSIGGEYQVEATVLPEDVVQSLTWTSLDSNIATVDSEGLVKGIDYGNTKIIATAIDGTNKVINVTVQEIEIPVTSIKINEKNINLKQGGSKKINVKIEPSDATNQKVIWTSSDETIATVNENGLVQGLMPGTAIIRVSTEEGQIAETNITVTKQASNILVKDLKLSQSSVTINEGSSVNIESTITPNNATNKKLKWSTNNSNVATVSNGMIYGKKVGTAVITATTSNNISRSIQVTVNPIVLNSISLSETSIKLGIGGEMKLYVTFKPANASDKRITWISSNNGIASIDSNGIVTGKSIGTTTIIAKSTNGKTVTCKVVVTNESIPVSNLVLNANKYIVKVGSTVGITPIISPSNATNQKISLSVNNTSIAKVESDGKIKGVKEGIVELVATSNNGKKTKAYVIVKNKNSSVNYLDGQSIKYWYDNTYGAYAVTHIWVKDPYNQFKMEIPDKFGTLASPNTLMKKAAKKNSNKTLIGINASGFVTESFSANLYKANKNWKNTSVSPIVIYEGKLIRDYTTSVDIPSATMKIYGMNNKGYLEYYSYKNKKEDNNGKATQILNNGVKYTFGWYPVLVNSGQVQNGLAKQNNIRQSICQIDKNNFLFITNISSNRGKGFSHYSLATKMKELGCQTGFNLDGGGSASIYYVKKGSTSPTKIKVMEGSYGRSIPDMIYFVGD